MQVARTAVLLVLVCSFVMAQSERGNITGIVTDPTGASVAGADVSITHRDTNAMAKAVSTATGEYNVPNLLPSLYAGMAYAEGVPQRTIAQNEITG